MNDEINLEFIEKEKKDLLNNIIKENEIIENYRNIGQNEENESKENELKISEQKESIIDYFQLENKEIDYPNNIKEKLDLINNIKNEDNEKNVYDNFENFKIENNDNNNKNQKNLNEENNNEINNNSIIIKYNEVDDLIMLNQNNDDNNYENINENIIKNLNEDENNLDILKNENLFKEELSNNNNKTTKIIKDELKFDNNEKGKQIINMKKNININLENIDSNYTINNEMKLNQFISISDLNDSELEGNINKEKLFTSNFDEINNKNLNNEEKLNTIKSEMKTIIKNIYKKNDNYNINYNQIKVNEKENKGFNKKNLEINTSYFEQIQNKEEKNTIVRSNSIQLRNKSPLIIKNNEKINNIIVPKNKQNTMKIENKKLIIPKEDKNIKEQNQYQVLKIEKQIIKKPQLKTPKSLENLQKNKTNLSELRKSNSFKYTLIQREKNQKTIETQFDQFDNYYFNNIKKNTENNINSTNEKGYNIKYNNKIRNNNNKNRIIRINENNKKFNINEGLLSFDEYIEKKNEDYDDRIKIKNSNYAIKNIINDNKIQNFEQLRNNKSEKNINYQGNIKLNEMIKPYTKELIFNNNNTSNQRNNNKIRKDIISNNPNVERDKDNLKNEIFDILRRDTILENRIKPFEFRRSEHSFREKNNNTMNYNLNNKENKYSLKNIKEKNNNSTINNQYNLYENRILSFESKIQNLNDKKKYLKEYKDKINTYDVIKSYNPTNKTQLIKQDKLYKEDYPKQIKEKKKKILSQSFIESNKIDNSINQKKQLKELSYLIQKPKTPIKGLKNEINSENQSPISNYDTNIYNMDKKEINQEDLKLLFRKEIPKPKKRKTLKEYNKFKSDEKPKIKSLNNQSNNNFNNTIQANHNIKLFQNENLPLTEFETDSEYIFLINSRKIKYKKGNGKKINEVSQLNKEQLSEINALIEKENIREIKNKRAESERRNFKVKLKFPPSDYNYNFRRSEKQFFYDPEFNLFSNNPENNCMNFDCNEKNNEGCFIM